MLDRIYWISRIKRTDLQLFFGRSPHYYLILSILSILLILS